MPKSPTWLAIEKMRKRILAISQSNLTTTELLVAYLSEIFYDATTEQIQGYVALCPDDPSAGSPFNTGDLHSTSSILNINVL